MGLCARDGFIHLDIDGAPRMFGITREQIIMSLAAERGHAITSDTEFDRAEEIVLAPGERIAPATSILKWENRA